MKKSIQIRIVCLLLGVLTLFSALCAPALAAAVEEQGENGAQTQDAAPATGDGTGALIAAAAFFLFAFGFAVVRMRKAGAA